jgi:hypothetical protein
MAMTRDRLLGFVRAARAVVGGDPVRMLALPGQPYVELTLDDGCVVMSLDGACLLRLQTIPAR